jgi:hypothetical protein
MKIYVSVVYITPVLALQLAAQNRPWQSEERSKGYLMGWFDEGAVQQFLDATLNSLALAYGWAKEWQPLLAGLLVVFAAIIVARSIRKPMAMRPLQTVPVAKDPPRLDLRQAEKPGGASPRGACDELVGNLEQLRSLIRSALAAFTLTTEKQNSPAFFLCQRIARFRLEQLPPNATKLAREYHTALLEQLELLRLHLKKDVPPAETAGILVQLNTSARNLLAALTPASDTRRQANSEVR